MILSLEFNSDIPIYQQIRNQIVIGISNGTFKEGERLPTIRALAAEIGVNTMTVNKAYSLLKQDGYIRADRRSGAIVNCKAVNGETIDIELKKRLQLLVSEFRLQGVKEDKFLSLCSELYEEE